MLGSLGIAEFPETFPRLVQEAVAEKSDLSGRGFGLGVTGFRVSSFFGWDSLYPLLLLPFLPVPTSGTQEMFVERMNK